MIYHIFQRANFNNATFQGVPDIHSKAVTQDGYQIQCSASISVFAWPDVGRRSSVIFTGPIPSDIHGWFQVSSVRALPVRTEEKASIIMPIRAGRREHADDRAQEWVDFNSTSGCFNFLSHQPARLSLEPLRRLTPSYSAISDIPTG